MARSDFISTSISLGAGLILEFVDKNNTKTQYDPEEIKSMLNILSTVCFNLERYAQQMHIQNYDQKMLEDMLNVLNVVNVVGLKWTSIKNGRNDVDIDFKFMGGYKD